METLSVSFNLCLTWSWLVLECQAEMLLSWCWRFSRLPFGFLGRAVAGMERGSRATLRANIPTKWPALQLLFQPVKTQTYLTSSHPKPKGNLNFETELWRFFLPRSAGKRGVIQRVPSNPYTRKKVPRSTYFPPQPQLMFSPCRI